MGYRVRYAEADGGVEVQEAPMLVIEASRTSCEISDLLKYTQYKVWVAAYTQIGDGPYSDVIIVQTDEDGRSLCLHLQQAPTNQRVEPD